MTQAGVRGRDATVTRPSNHRLVGVSRDIPVRRAQRISSLERETRRMPDSAEAPGLDWCYQPRSRRSVLPKGRNGCYKHHETAFMGPIARREAPIRLPTRCGARGEAAVTCGLKALTWRRGRRPRSTRSSSLRTATAPAPVGSARAAAMRAGTRPHDCAVRAVGAPVETGPRTAGIPP
jgi:hypothetical protein